MPALIWPLLDKLMPMVALQQRPRSTGCRGVQRLPTTPWDDCDRPPFARGYGKVEGTPNQWELAPWNFGLCAIGVNSVKITNFKTNPRVPKISEQSRIPAVVRFPVIPARISMISGVTKDNTGAVLGSCTVELYLTATNEPLAKVTSDATTGAFTFTCARYSPATHYIVAYKSGGTDVAGTSLNTLVGT